MKKLRRFIDISLLPKKIIKDKDKTMLLLVEVDQDFEKKRPLIKGQNGGFELDQPTISFDKISVHVEGGDAVDSSTLENKDFTTVTFKNLVAQLYFIKNTVGVKAKADSITLDGQSEAA